MPNGLKKFTLCASKLFNHLFFSIHLSHKFPLYMHISPDRKQKRTLNDTDLYPLNAHTFDQCIPFQWYTHNFHITMNQNADLITFYHFIFCCCNYRLHFIEFNSVQLISTLVIWNPIWLSKHTHTYTDLNLETIWCFVLKIVWLEEIK